MRAAGERWIIASGKQIEHYRQTPETREVPNIQVPFCFGVKWSLEEQFTHARQCTWFFIARLLDEGDRTAVYPYSRLKPIRSRDEVREAVLDETLPLETEFGRQLVEPLYNVIWRLNTGNGIATSHTVVAPEGRTAPYEWAKHYVAAQIIFLSRNEAERLSYPETIPMINEFRLAVVQSPRFQEGDRKGWFIQLSPTGLRLETRPGFGGSLIIGGCASSRARAAQRFSRGCTLISEILFDLQEAEGVIPAPPYEHPAVA